VHTSTPCAREILVDRGLAGQAAAAAPLAEGVARATPYAAMAREGQLAWPTLDDVTSAAKAFLDPVLAGDPDATWGPDTWAWTLP
jgi:hypothetical protein